MRRVGTSNPLLGAELMTRFSQVEFVRQLPVQIATRLADCLEYREVDAGHIIVRASFETRFACSCARRIVAVCRVTICTLLL